MSNKVLEGTVSQTDPASAKLAGDLNAFPDQPPGQVCIPCIIKAIVDFFTKPEPPLIDQIKQDPKRFEKAWNMAANFWLNVAMLGKFPGGKLGKPLEAAKDAGAPNAIRKVVLGIEDFLDEFARTHGAESWKQFAKADPMRWKTFFLAVMNDAKIEILFNLKGVDVWAGVTRASRGAGGATDWELLQIKMNKEWWPRIKWMLDGVEVPNPFE